MERSKPDEGAATVVSNAGPISPEEASAIISAAAGHLQSGAFTGLPMVHKFETHGYDLYVHKATEDEWTLICFGTYMNPLDKKGLQQITQNMSMLAPFTGTNESPGWVALCLFHLIDALRGKKEVKKITGIGHSHGGAILLCLIGIMNKNPNYKICAVVAFAPAKFVSEETSSTFFTPETLKNMGCTYNDNDWVTGPRVCCDGLPIETRILQTPQAEEPETQPPAKKRKLSQVFSSAAKTVVQVAKVVGAPLAHPIETARQVARASGHLLPQIIEAIEDSQNWDGLATMLSESALLCLSRANKLLQGDICLYS